MKINLSKVPPLVYDRVGVLVLAPKLTPLHPRRGTPANEVISYQNSFSLSNSRSLDKASIDLY